MKTLILHDLQQAVRDVGITENSHLIMHSSLFSLGIPEMGLERGVPAVLQAILDVIGTGGTLVAPSFVLSFPHHRCYHYADTKSDGMGILSEAVRLHPDALRTRHPMQSLSCIGHYRDALYSIITDSVYSRDSAFDFLYQHDFKILLLGVDGITVAMSHMAEEWANVPYRYWKILDNAQVTFSEGRDERDWPFFARKLEINPIMNENHTHHAMRDHHLLNETQLNGAYIGCYGAQDYVNLLLDALADNPLFLLDNADEVKAQLT